MKFRFTAFGIHLLCSIVALSTILGALYVGWYRWPGWYLADVLRVVLVMVGVDVVMGPLLTFIIASEKKPRRELARDIGIIVAVQLAALLYGTTQLWNGRPLYYAFSEDVLQLVQSYDISAQEAELGRKQNPTLAPHWYEFPRWMWAPLPEDPQEHDKFIAAVIAGGDDVISMPRYYRPWDRGLPMLRGQLKKIDDIKKYFVGRDTKLLSERMRVAGLPTDQPNAIPLTGRGRPLLAVFDLKRMQLVAVLSVK